jgi:hypothetical protein
MHRLTWVVCLGAMLGAGAMPHAGAPQSPQRPDPAPPTFRVDACLATNDLACATYTLPVSVAQGERARDTRLRSTQWVDFEVR